MPRSRNSAVAQGRAVADHSTQTEAVVICYKCGGVGHVARNCLPHSMKITPRQANGKGGVAAPPLFLVKTAAEYHSCRLEAREGLPTIRVKVCGVRRRFIVDSGYGVSLIQPGVRGGKIKPSTATTIGVTGNRLRLMGEQEICFSLNGCIYEHTFGILPLPTDADGILGTDFLIKMQASINLGKGEIKVAKHVKLSHSPSDPGTRPDDGRQHDEVRRKRRGWQAGKRKMEREAIVCTPQVRLHKQTQANPTGELPKVQYVTEKRGGYARRGAPLLLYKHGTPEPKNHVIA